MKILRFLVAGGLLLLPMAACNTDDADDEDSNMGDTGTRSPATEDIENGDSVPGTYQDISAKEAMDMLSEFTEIFDVSPHFYEGHLPGARETSGVSGLEDIASDLDSNGTYLVYCHADAPSIAGAEALIEEGIKNVYRLEGNYSAWDDLYYVDISPARADEENSVGAYEAIFDVSPIYDSGHLPGAINAGSVDGLKSLLDSYDVNGSYLVYCHADEPAMAGAQAMEDMGFHSVYRLEGNFSAWQEGGYAVE